MLEASKRLRTLNTELDTALTTAAASDADIQQRVTDMTRQLRDCKRTVDRVVTHAHLPADMYALAVSARDAASSLLNDFESLLVGVADGGAPFELVPAVARAFSAVDGFLDGQIDFVVRRDSAQPSGYVCVCVFVYARRLS